MNDDIDMLLGKLDAHPGSFLFARLADAYLQADKLNEAVEICEQGLAHHAEYTNGHLIMARCYARLGLRDQATVEYQRTLQIDGDHMAGLLNLGDMYYEGKRMNRARHCYQHALESDPLSETVLNRISSLTHHGSPPAPKQETPVIPAGAEFERHETISTVTLAEIYAAQGLTEKAVYMYRRVLTRSPDRERISKRIQELENQLRHEEEGGTNGDDR